MSFVMVVTFGGVAAESQVGFHADVEAMVILGSEEALHTFVFVDHHSIERFVHSVGPMRTRHSSFSHLNLKLKKV